MSHTYARRTLAVLAATTLGSVTFAAEAGAHAHVSPSIVEKGHSETYTVVVPSEGASTTASVVLTVPDGFQIGAFEATPGVKRDVVATGSGDEAAVSKVTWTGLKVPEGEAAYLRFQGSSTTAGSYAFKVRQTYASGEVADWSGAASADFPAPLVEVRDSLGGGGGDGTDALAVIALILAGLALVLGLGGMARRGGRSLT